MDGQQMRQQHQHRMLRPSLQIDATSSSHSDDIMVPSFGDNLAMRFVRVILVVSCATVLSLVLGHLIIFWLFEFNPNDYPLKWSGCIFLIIESVFGLYGAAKRKQQILIFFVILCLMGATSLFILARMDRTSGDEWDQVIRWFPIGYQIFTAVLGCLLAANDSNKVRVHALPSDACSNSTSTTRMHQSTTCLTSFSSRPPHYSTVVQSNRLAPNIMTKQSSNAPSWPMMMSEHLNNGISDAASPTRNVADSSEDKRRPLSKPYEPSRHLHH